jgi:cation diffusion facilitator CzcD-associated flavoprotein CzcO
VQAVVGGGAAGLAAARELLLEGHRVRVYEKGSHIGGVWVYTAEVEDDPLGVAPGGWEGARRIGRQGKSGWP